MITLLVSAALAVAPGGFRVDGALPVRALAFRPVFVMTAGEPSVFQTTVAGRWSTGHALVDVGVPFVATWGHGLTDLGAGNVRVALSGLFGPERRPTSIGAELALPLAPSWASVSAWGSNARETVPTAEVLVVYQLAFDTEAPWTLRLAAGFMFGPAWRGGVIGGLPSAELGVAHVVPVSDALAVVVEGEVMVDRTPLSARVLVRHSEDRSAFDLGLQLPLLAYGEAIPTLQIVGQVKLFF